MARRTQRTLTAAVKADFVVRCLGELLESREQFLLIIGICAHLKCEARRSRKREIYENKVRLECNTDQSTTHGGAKESQMQKEALAEE